jgi:hypothetical protein
MILHTIYDRILIKWVILKPIFGNVTFSIEFIILKGVYKQVLDYNNKLKIIKTTTLKWQEQSRLQERTLVLKLLESNSLTRQLERLQLFLRVEASRSLIDSDLVQLP